jgi:glycogen debranching enzyme
MTHADRLTARSARRTTTVGSSQRTPSRPGMTRTMNDRLEAIPNAEPGQPMRLDESSDGRTEHKHRVLSQSTPSVVRSIADAIVIKSLDLFFLCQPDGEVPVTGEHGFGLYHHDCRYLRGYELHLAGATVNPLAASAGAGSRAVFESTNADIRMANGRLVPKEAIGVTWTREVDGRRLELTDEIRLTNYGAVAAAFPVQIRLDAAFEDMFQVRGLEREQLGASAGPEVSSSGVLFRYEGADGRQRSLAVQFDPSPEVISDGAFVFHPQLEPGARWALHVRLALTERETSGHHDTDAPDEPLDRPLTAADRHMSSWLQDRTTVVSDSVLLDAVIERSLGDLRILQSVDTGERYFAAGVPWFVALFGRDSLITAIQVLAFDPDIAADTLRLLASRQGTKVDPWRDEEPGKILHELRVGEYARTGRIPHTPYYGSVDATPLFLVALGRHAQWVGDLSLFRDLRPQVDAAIEWIATNETAHAGYVAYDSQTGLGLANQGWKDSGDAIVNRDGSLARPPIALVEVQGYVYEAKVLIADLFERDGDPMRAKELRQQAEHLRARFDQDFWTGDATGHALAIQGDGSPCQVIASNPGHALWSGIVNPLRAERTTELLMDERMFTGWGIRTFAEGQRRFNPIGYHLGTVWPHDNSLIAAGFRRYGFDGAALRIFSSMLEAAMPFEETRLPEAFAGFPRAAFGAPVRYPVACHPQAWAAGAIPYLLQTILGLVPDAFERRLRVERPMLPPFLERVELKRLRVGDARVSLEFRRRDDRVTVDVRGVEGDLAVEVDDSHAH